MTDTTRLQDYWKQNIRRVLTLLAVWFLVSYVFSILLVNQLDAVKIGGFRLGFWFAQQGSIYVFVALIFIYGIGWTLKDGYPHEMRAADYDDWVTETASADGRPMPGLNGDILVWNPVTRRRHELTSMGVRVNPETLVKQLEITGQLDFLPLPYHQAIINNNIPLSIGGGIGQSRTYMLLLKKAHLGEVSVTVWPKILKDMCSKKHIHVLE